MVYLWSRKSGTLLDKKARENGRPSRLWIMACLSRLLENLSLPDACLRLRMNVFEPPVSSVVPKRLPTPETRKSSLKTYAKLSTHPKLSHTLKDSCYSVKPLKNLDGN